MAQRRMFSPEIVCSDAFFELPTSSRELYFQLGMKADDDGFVNPRATMRMCGASEDDLRILCAKRFAIPFQSGVIVIKHWKINNLVRKDWYRPTLHEEEKEQLTTKKNGAYTELVNDSLTEDRIGKDRLLAAAKPSAPIEVPDSEEEERPKRKLKYPHSKEVFSWFPSPQRNWEINTTELRHAELLWERGEDKVRKNLKYVLSHQDEDYFPKVNKPSDLERKWNDIAYEYGRRK